MTPISILDTDGQTSFELAGEIALRVEENHDIRDCCSRNGPIFLSIRVSGNWNTKACSWTDIGIGMVVSVRTRTPRPSMSS